MKRWIVVIALLIATAAPAHAQTDTPIPIVVTVILVPASPTPSDTPTATLSPTPGDSPTPTPTITPTFDTLNAWRIDTTGGTQQDAGVRFEVTAGEFMIGFLLLLILGVLMLDVFLRFRERTE